MLRDLTSYYEGLASIEPTHEVGSILPYRRNALNPEDEGQLPDTKRHKKTSIAGRLYETSELSDIALSHHVQRTVQPSKCSHCDTLSILYTVQCIDCGSQWHKTCFPKVSFFTITISFSSSHPFDFILYYNLSMCRKKGKYSNSGINRIEKIQASFSLTNHCGLVT
uniref:Phorbol-ester/DAG-type domain-containing protein n=1 Tax=Angiostrongylus cantonensis TaxID=6313 RepID=A0A0K0DN71_ANGCA